MTDVSWHQNCFSTGKEKPTSAVLYPNCATFAFHPMSSVRMNIGGGIFGFNTLIITEIILLFISFNSVAVGY